MPFLKGRAYAYRYAAVADETPFHSHGYAFLEQYRDSGHTYKRAVFLPMNLYHDLLAEKHRSAHDPETEEHRGSRLRNGG